MLLITGLSYTEEGLNPMANRSGLVASGNIAVFNYQSQWVPSSKLLTGSITTINRMSLWTGSWWSFELKNRTNSWTYCKVRAGHRRHFCTEKVSPHKANQSPPQSSEGFSWVTVCAEPTGTLLKLHHEKTD